MQAFANLYFPREVTSQMLWRKRLREIAVYSQVALSKTTLCVVELIHIQNVISNIKML